MPRAELFCPFRAAGQSILLGTNRYDFFIKQKESAKPILYLLTQICKIGGITIFLYAVAWHFPLF